MLYANEWKYRKIRSDAAKDKRKPESVFLFILTFQTSNVGKVDESG